MEVPVSAEATIQGGASAGTDVSEAVAGYLHVKYHTSTFDLSRKVYFQFDLANQAADTNAPATLTVNFIASNKQRVQLWGLNQAYPGFSGSITWNTAQANDTTSNNLLTNGSFTAKRIGVDVLIPTTGMTPYTFTIPRLGDVLISNKVTLVLTSVYDAANSSGGLRVQMATSALGFSQLGGHSPPVFSSISPQTISLGESTGPIPFTLTDDQDLPASLNPVAISSNEAILSGTNMVFGGSGGTRTIRLTAGGQFGKATVTLSAVDSHSQTGSTSFAVTVLPTNSASTHYDVYFATGQSNMDGRGSTNDLTGILAPWNQPQADVRIYYANPMNSDWANPDYNTGWQVFEPGFSVPPGFSGALPSTRFGPELAFARSVADVTTNGTVAIIKVSKGGTSLSNDWKPGVGYMYLTMTNIARLAIESLTNGGASYTLRGMIWHQGESDGSASVATYQARLTEFIEAVRRDLGVANLPFVVGELATNRSLTVRQAQKNVAQTVPYVGFASSSNLVTLAADDPHFNSAGALIMGQRMAAALELPPVRLLSVRLEGDSLAINGSGLARSACRLLAATNLALPVPQWETASTKLFNQDGTVTFSIPRAVEPHAEFFMIVGE